MKRLKSKEGKYTLKENYFYAMLSRMKYINRWGLMQNTRHENLCEHSLEVAFIAHALGIINNEIYSGNIDAERLAILGMYHDVTEIITGDLPTPVKYYNPVIRNAYKEVEYDLQNLNDALPFENLQAGTYQYRVTASNATNQNYIVINQSFVISSDPTVQVEATEDAITIENGSKIPNITVGTSVSISGIVRSASSNITTITVGVYDSNHKMVTGKNA